MVQVFRSSGLWVRFLRFRVDFWGGDDFGRVWESGERRGVWAVWERFWGLIVGFNIGFDRTKTTRKMWSSDTFSKNDQNS